MTTNGAHDHGLTKPSRWVQRFLKGVKPGGSVLDVACGAGRHMRLALEMGYSVTGIDKDLSEVEDLADRKDVGLVEADLETGRAFPLKDMRYDGVIVTNYLHRPILSDIVGCVATDGVLIYETAAVGNEDHPGPSNPDYLLKPNELITAVVPDLVVVAYEYGIRSDRAPSVIARIAACGQDHDWVEKDPVPVGSFNDE